MEEGGSVLELIRGDEDDNFDYGGGDDDDVVMMDVEDGEFVEEKPPLPDLKQGGGGGGGGGGESVGNQHGSESRNRKRRANKKRNNKKRRRSGPGPNVTDINKFVLDVCRRLKEKKSYMVYTAVGCLGVSALNDFVKEVDAIQSCGGQMTVDGQRFRTGGGVLWNIIKTREPEAYKEITKKAREFEKQFKQQNAPRQAPVQEKKGSSDKTTCTFAERNWACVEDGSELVPHNQPIAESKRRSVHDRIRVAVSYDDLLGNEYKDD